VTAYRFSVIVHTPQLTQDDILDATDILADAGCTDASICGHVEGMELMFERDAASLQAALSSAVADVESAGYRVERVEVEREAIPN
jgi:hypothetical protein